MGAAENGTVQNEGDEKGKKKRRREDSEVELLPQSSPGAPPALCGMAGACTVLLCPTTMFFPFAADGKVSTM